ncbi:MAG: holo-ACP synthase [Candidatus Cloacimonetes bacterium]|nr:holo-ACP synthase [Candidatus Cloacimonadota bacterium]
MIFGIGIDLTEIDRIKNELKEHKDRFCKMVFTEKEIKYCESKKNSAENYAARFAAKEAFFKAIGTGWGAKLKWKDVEVKNDELGKPGIILKNKARKIIEKNEVTNIQLSISHSKNYATAVVVLETNSNN